MFLTGLQRFQLTRLWVKRGHEGNKEDFIQKVYEAKGIIYVAPRKVI